MPRETYYCGNCGTALYYGRKFKEHTGAVACPSCGRQNPVYFHYCYTCGHPMAPNRDQPQPSIG